MEGITLFIVTLLIILLLVLLSTNRNALKDLPGPWTNEIPIIGSLHILIKKPFEKLTELAKKYGPLYRLRIGSIDVVVITDFEIMKEAFAKDAFMGRPPDLSLEHTRKTTESGAFNGLAWKEQRRFSLHMLRDLGFGRTTMEDFIKEEIQELLQRVAAQEGKPIKHATLLAPSVSNNITYLLFGKRLSYNDPDRETLDRLVGTIGRGIGSNSLRIYFPWLKAITNTFNIGDNGKLFKVINEMRCFIKKQIQEHEATLDRKNIRDFLDSYLLEIQKKSNDENTTFKKDVLSDLSRLFFGAGSETVRDALTWMLLVCAVYPDVQKKIQSEIDEIIGQDRFPTWKDHLKMPFTEAAIAELLRWKTILPLNLMRYTLEDTYLKGHFIPKHTRVLSVIWAVDHDTKLWGTDAHIYKPERFLSEDGRKVVKPDFAIPFSIGKRSCPGQSFADIEVFLYLTAILRSFELRPPPGKQIDLEGDLGLTLQPRNQEICFKKRH